MMNKTRDSFQNSQKLHDNEDFGDDLENKTFYVTNHFQNTKQDQDLKKYNSRQFLGRNRNNALKVCNI